MNKNKPFLLSQHYECDDASVIHLRPTSRIYKSICSTLCDAAIHREKWGYILLNRVVLAFDLPLFKRTGGQRIPD